MVYKNIVDSMDGGVLTISPEGDVTTFNAAASRILGMAPDDVLGRSFGEAFVPVEGLDAFNQEILNAVYDRSVGHQQAVEVTLAGTQRSLAVTTSYLQTVEDGVARQVGVVAIFGDISEIKELREAELRLAEAAKVQHAKLQDAYRDIEAKNEALGALLKRVQVFRVTATVLVVGLFGALGVYAWDTAVPDPGPVERAATGGDGPRTAVAARQRIASTVSLVGTLAPRRDVNVTSPITGKVAATHFRYGERVAAGQRLIDLDTAEVEREYRDAQAAHIKTVQRVNELTDWESGIEVSRTRRAISKARVELDAQEAKVTESARLLERGVIPALEHAAEERRYGSQLLDYETLQQDLQAVLAKGGEDAMRVARLELDNAETRLRELEEILRQAAVDAPVAGVVLRPAGDGADAGGNGTDFLAPGRSVTQGELLLTIGDLDGLSVRGQVDEVDVVQVLVGQGARVTGDAFADLELAGTIASVSSQARQGQGNRALPSFDVAVALDPLTAEQRRRLRVGMSANLEVVVYDNPDALVVPIEAVEARGGRTWLRVVDGETGTESRVEVAAGLTTLDGVEILSGLADGDEVALSGG